MTSRLQQYVPLDWQWDDAERFLARVGFAALAVVIVLIAIAR